MVWTRSMAARQRRREMARAYARNMRLNNFRMRQRRNRIRYNRFTDLNMATHRYRYLRRYVGTRGSLRGAYR